MKRTAAIALTIALAFGATACSGSEDTEADSADTSAAAEASDAAADASDEASEGERDASEAATSLAAEASEAGASLAAEASKAADEVNWEKYPDQLREEIDAWTAEDNCSGLNDVVDSFSLAGNDELVDYVKTRIEEAGCA